MSIKQFDSMPASTIADERCPICGKQGTLKYHLASDFIQQELKRYFAAETLPDLGIRGYDVIACQNCFLEFSTPPVPGSKEFYEWITSKIGYYSGARWEYETIMNILPEGSRVRLLDIGCGDGEFLSLVSKLPNVSAIGIDVTPSSVAKCRQKGLDVYCLTLDELLRKYEELTIQRSFDVVVAFHVIEHIAEPLQLVKTIKNLLSDSGRIILSTPYSPASYEYSFYAPLNNPPHHLTRWNKSVYLELARQVDLKVRFFLPRPVSMFKRVIQSLRLGLYSGKDLTRPQMALLPLRHPYLAGRDLYYQFRREKINGQTAPDIILVELSKC